MGGENLETGNINSSSKGAHYKGKQKNGVITGVRSWVTKEFFVFKMGEIPACFHANRNHLLERQN